MFNDCHKIYTFLNENKVELMNLPDEFYEKNGYEKYFAQALKLVQSNAKNETRYWDVKSETHEVLIELKKSKKGTYFLDNVRYCEMYLAKLGNHDHELKYPNDAKKSSVTCFIKTNEKED